MKNVTSHIGKLEIINRLPSSRNGNPRWLLRIDGWTCRTAPDAAIAYGIRNFEGKTSFEWWRHYVPHARAALRHFDTLTADRDRLKARVEEDLAAERDFLSSEARRYASHYPEASDGRNTFIIFAEMIEARAARQALKGEHA